jgi:anion-transporting  ArsA/GET3 family ATPase
MSRRANLTIVIGGGGVGKTTTSAALALGIAKRGRRALVVTVDPARRLADALGVQIGIESQSVKIDGAELWARMPDARRSVDIFADWLFQDPAANQRVKQNGMYRELSNALAGVHELISVAFVDHELENGGYEEIVLDTAPSRHALEFLDYPARLARMLETRTLEWVASLARLAGASIDDRPDGKGLVAWGKRRVGRLVSGIVGVHAIRDIASLFAEFVLVRERWLELVRRVEYRIHAETTRYFVVAGPSGSALADAEYLLGQLQARDLRAHAFLLNRAVDGIPAWLETLATRATLEPALAPAIAAYVDEHRARAEQTEFARRSLRALAGPEARLLLLPALRASDPRDILRAIAGALEKSDVLA